MAVRVRLAPGLPWASWSLLISRVLVAHGQSWKQQRGCSPAPAHPFGRYTRGPVGWGVGSQYAFHIPLLQHAAVSLLGTGCGWGGFFEQNLHLSLIYYACLFFKCATE